MVVPRFAAVDSNCLHLFVH